MEAAFRRQLSIFVKSSLIAVKNICRLLFPLAVSLFSFLPPAISQEYPAIYAIDATQPVGIAPVYRLIDAQAAYESHWDTLPQVQFWRRLIRLSPDSSLVNIAATRTVLAVVSTDDWNLLSSREKTRFLQNMRQKHGLPAARSIYVTAGKADYYHLEAALPDIDRSIRIFEENGTEPWYAQAVLMVESPGALRASPAGARGAFQLMPYVARTHGLRVDREVDERTELDKSAAAAAQFISNTCLPEARRLLRYRGIRYQESELWFRLLVLHVYHAGSQNVSNAMDTFRPRSGGMSLIQQLWKAETGDFRNASQNYSQVALATWLELQEMVYRQYDVACEADSSATEPDWISEK